MGPVCSGHCVRQPPIYSSQPLLVGPVCSGHCVRQPPAYSSQPLLVGPVHSGHCVRQPPVYSRLLYSPNSTNTLHCPPAVQPPVYSSQARGQTGDNVSLGCMCCIDATHQLLGALVSYDTLVTWLIPHVCLCLLYIYMHPPRQCLNVCTFWHNSAK